MPKECRATTAISAESFGAVHECTSAQASRLDGQPVFSRRTGSDGRGTHRAYDGGIAQGVSGRPVPGCLIRASCGPRASQRVSEDSTTRAERLGSNATARPTSGGACVDVGAAHASGGSGPRAARGWEKAQQRATALTPRESARHRPPRAVAASGAVRPDPPAPSDCPPTGQLHHENFDGRRSRSSARPALRAATAARSTTLRGSI